MKNIVIIVLIFASARTAFSQTFIVSFSANKVIGCDTLTVQFKDETTAPGITKWDWDFGDNTFESIQNPKHKYLSPGNFTVKLTSTRISGTESTQKINYIKVYNNPIANFQFSDSAFTTSFSVQLTSTTHFDTLGFTYKWNFGDNDSAQQSRAIHTYKKEGTYPVTLKVIENSNGCTNDTTKNVTVSSKFIIPNVFTPNGDGINDEFLIKTTGISTYTFEVLDRWGNLMYSVTEKSIRWDGRSSAGTPLVSGTYFYILTSKDDSGHSKMTGFFELVR